MAARKLRLSYEFNYNNSLFADIINSALFQWFQLSLLLIFQFLREHKISIYEKK